MDTEESFANTCAVCAWDDGCITPPRCALRLQRERDSWKILAERMNDRLDEQEKVNRDLERRLHLAEQSGFGYGSLVLIYDALELLPKGYTIDYRTGPIVFDTVTVEDVRATVERLADECVSAQNQHRGVNE